jgi:hypothetical protein
MVESQPENQAPSPVCPKYKIWIKAMKIKLLATDSQ